MTEEQADIIIKLLDRIDNTLSTIESNTPSSVYDLGDVCSRLDDIERAIKNMD